MGECIRVTNEGAYERRDWSNGNISYRINTKDMQYLIVTIRKIGTKVNGYKLMVNDIHVDPPKRTFNQRDAIKWAKEYLWSRKIETKGVLV